MADNPRIDELRRRVQKDPASIAFAQLAEEHRRVGNYDEAAQVARDGLARHPSYLSARVTLGRALLELEQYDEAQAELDQVLLLAPDNLAAIRAQAEIHQRRGELGEAARHYSTALDVSRSELVLPTLGEFDLPALPAIPEHLDFKLDTAIGDFNRSLDTFDSLDLDLPPLDGPREAPLAAPMLAEPHLLDAPPAEPPPVNPALTELEGWLAAILDDRSARA